MSATIVACILLFGVASLVSAKRAPSQCRGIHGFGYGTCGDADPVGTPTVDTSGSSTSAAASGKTIVVTWEPYTFADEDLWVSHYKMEINTAAGKKLKTIRASKSSKVKGVIKTFNEIKTANKTFTGDFLTVGTPYKVRVLAIAGDGSTSQWSKYSAAFKVKTEKNKGDGKDKDKGKNR